MLSFLFGKQFLGAYAPLMVLMIVPFLGIFSFPLAPMLLALGRADGPLKAKILATRSSSEASLLFPGRSVPRRGGGPRARRGQSTSWR